MKIFESTPWRYDKGIRRITLGRLDKAYDRLTSHIEKGQRVLDLGCGTGILTLRAAQKNANVKGIDINSQMLTIARRRVRDANLTESVVLSEMGVAELGGEDSESYDVVMTGLCFSELTEDELRYTLRETKRILKPGGLLLVADEAKAESVPKRILNSMMRLPLVILTYMVAGTTSRPLDNLREWIEGSGLVIESARLNRMENFIELVGRKLGKRVK